MMTTESCSLAQKVTLSPEKVAAAMVATLDPPGPQISNSIASSEGSGVLSLPPPIFALLSKRLEKIDNDPLVPWSAEVSRLVPGGREKLVPLLVATAILPEFYRNDKQVPEEIRKYTARLKSVTPETLARWEESAKAFGNTNALTTVLLLNRHAPLFESEKFTPERNERELSRFKNLPPESVSAWAVAVWREGQGIPLGSPSAAFSLLRVQELFTGTAFEKARFDAALQAAKDLIAPRAAKSR